MSPNVESLFQTRNLRQFSIAEAIEAQFSIVDVIQRHFGHNGLARGGDYGQVTRSAGNSGLVIGGTRPETTERVERAVAEIFGVEDCALVWGAGTGAISLSLLNLVRNVDKLIIHDAPIYKTTEQTLKSLRVELVKTDFRSRDEITSVLGRGTERVAVYLQHIPQSPGEQFSVEEVISFVKTTYPSVPVLVDDNYAVFRALKIGVQMGADVSMFSFFKLRGPEGVGCIVGSQQWIKEIRQFMSSAGCQIQGPLALEALRGMIDAPTVLAIQNSAVEEVANRINRFVETGVRPWLNWVVRAGSVQASHRNVVVQFTKPIADDFLRYVWEAGASAYPIGEESKYDITPMFYRLSSNYLKSNPDLESFTVRINPFRSGPGTVIQLMEVALNGLEQAFH